MCLKQELLQGIYAYGFKEPSAIQQKGIMPIIQGKDIIAQAQSGTGKTGTFTISLLQSIDASQENIQAIVVAPTRELSQQIGYVVHSIGEYMKVKVHVSVGGSDARQDAKMLQQGVQVVVGTPGRICDMMRRGALKTDYVRLCVIDEADEMLAKDFKPQIQAMFKHFPGDTQIALFSATFPQDVLDLTT